MKIARTIAQVREQIARWKGEGITVGLVPTMGFLHEGHESLMQAAAKENSKVVVSIFVNPTQFAPGEDLERYPRDFAHDEQVCRDNGVAMIFHPEVDEIYPAPFYTSVHVEALYQGLCGLSRPTHFSGVCTVVSKLFNIVQPDRAYFGQKDAQQLAIIRKMAQDLNFPVSVVGCPIVREKDGLAKSSRNAYLTAEERKAAVILSRTLGEAQERLLAGERSGEALETFIKERLMAEPLARVDYIAAVDSKTLQPLETLQGTVLVALAVFFGKTRLIDNIVVEL